MKRTDATGHASNLYTEGNPASGIPATVVGAEEMNNIQEELCNVVEAAGITLDGEVFTQLLQGLNVLIAQGGGGVSTPNSPNKKLNILDNQSTPVNLSGLVLDPAKYACVIIEYHVARRDDAKSAIEIGTLKIVYDPEGATYELFQESTTPDGQTQDVGVTFDLTGGQLRYASTNYGGANYTGFIRCFVKNILI